MSHVLELVALVAIFGSAATVVAYLALESGVLHVGSAATFGLGAYAYTVARLNGLSVLIAPAAAVLVACLVGYAAALVTMRLRGSHLALATMAVGIVVHGVLLNATSITAGPMGLRVPLGPILPTLALQSVALLATVIGLTHFITRHRWGARVRALRDDEQLSRDLGLNPRRTRLVLFVVSSAILAVVGSLYAQLLRFIDPSSFTVAESIAVLAMALIIPVATSIRGLCGAALYVLLPEALRFVGLGERGADLRQIIFAAILFVAVMRGATSPERSEELV